MHLQESAAVEQTVSRLHVTQQSHVHNSSSKGSRPCFTSFDSLRRKPCQPVHKQHHLMSIVYSVETLCKSHHMARVFIEALLSDSIPHSQA